MSQLVCYVCFDNCRLVSNGHILFAQGGLCLYIYIYIYISFLLSEKMIEQQKLIFVRARALVFRKCRDPFGAHDRNQRVVVSWEMSAIKFFYQCSGAFSLRMTFTRFNPGYIFLPLIYFFLVLIV